MKWYNDMFKMTSRISLLLCGAVAFASAADSTLVEKQKNLVGTLDSLNSSVMGLRLGGTAKAGVLSSKLSSDQLLDQQDFRENQAYTDVNLVVRARPSEETEAKVELRLHKDWQEAYEEPINPIIGHWFSYDGKILNKHVDFNLGYMRVGYTPLTIYVPQTEILQEPEIFAAKRSEALALRSLDTSSNRLLQGLNFRYNSFEMGPLSNLYVQMTGARIRNIAKKKCCLTLTGATATWRAQMPVLKHSELPWVVTTCTPSTAKRALVLAMTPRFRRCITKITWSILES